MWSRVFLLFLCPRVAPALLHLYRRCKFSHFRNWNWKNLWMLFLSSQETIETIFVNPLDSGWLTSLDIFSSQLTPREIVVFLCLCFYWEFLEGARLQESYCLQESMRTTQNILHVSLSVFTETYLFWRRRVHVEHVGYWGAKLPLVPPTSLIRSQACLQ